MIFDNDWYLLMIYLFQIAYTSKYYQRLVNINSGYWEWLFFSPLANPQFGGKLTRKILWMDWPFVAKYQITIRDLINRLPQISGWNGTFLHCEWAPNPPKGFVVTPTTGSARPWSRHFSTKGAGDPRKSPCCCCCCAKYLAIYMENLHSPAKTM